MSYEARLTDLDNIEETLSGEDLELIRKVMPRVDNFVRSTEILDTIVARYFADGLIDKAMVFQYVGRAYGEEDTKWWVIVGDLPPFMDSALDGETAVDAVHNYCHFMKLILDEPDLENPTQELPPFCYGYSTKKMERTPEIIAMVRGRLKFLENSLIPWMLSGSYPKDW